MSTRFRIGDLTLDTGRHQVLRESKSIPLGPLTYRLLLTLVEAAPNVVSHDELIHSIWNGRIVSPETINQRVKLLRDALSDDPHEPRYVESARGRGYRLVPRVEILPDEASGRGRMKWLMPVATATSLVLGAAILLWILHGPQQVAEENSSVAVLPFVDLSAEQNQQYLADGIAEEILTLLSQATTLRVIARTSSFSFRGQDADIARIANTLGVTHVLEGSVRQSGDRIRITARLVDASNGSRVWSESYDQQLGDVLALQTDVARSVAAALRAGLQAKEEVESKRVNAEAHDLYLRGQQKLRLQEAGEAADYFERAIALDGDFIPAYCALGAAYVVQVITVTADVTENSEKLREVLRRGLDLAPNDAGLLALSAQLARYDGDMERAEELFARALESDSSNSVLRIIFPIFKLDQGYPKEALAINRRSLEIDPLNPLIYVNSWVSYLDLWDADGAMETVAHYREIASPADPTADALTALTKLLLMGDLAGSIGATVKTAALPDPEQKQMPYWLPMLYYYIDDLKTADELMGHARQSGSNPSDMVVAEAYRHLAHGDIDEARRLALSALEMPRIWGGNDDDFTILRLALDAMIQSREAGRAVELLEKLAPEYGRYKRTDDIEAREFSPAPVTLKSAFSTYPALYFPDYIRALRASGDAQSAERMLRHLDAVLDLRRKHGLFLEERHAAEALALRGETEAALDALEKAERDRTIYHRWHLVLLHNDLFAALRDHPRFVALVERIRRDLAEQREQLTRLAVHRYGGAVNDLRIVAAQE